VVVPLAIVGPLHIEGEYAKGEYWVPVATTEWSLAAPLNRGCKAILRAGGCRTHVLKDSITRAPVFLCQDSTKAKDTSHWVMRNLNELREIAKRESRYTTLKGISAHQVGHQLYLRMEFTPGDAMGMNMATQCYKWTRQIRYRRGINPGGDC
jgi:hydroxymethylglutaryl-CoA reductase (NADPH)